MTPSPSPYSQYQQPAPQKKGRGCLIALAIVGTLAVVALVGGGVLVWKFAKSETGQKIGEFATKSQKMMEEAASNPVAKELSATLCPGGATVLDTAKLQALGNLLRVDAGPVDDEPASMQITCAVRDAASAPTCEAVANVYLKAADRPQAIFTVMVKAGIAPKPRCTAIYNQAGELVEKDGKAVGK